MLTAGCVGVDAGGGDDIDTGVGVCVGAGMVADCGVDSLSVV